MCYIIYIGQICGEWLRTWFDNHQQYIRTNNPKSAYVMHILNNKHKYGPIQITIDSIKSCEKGRKWNCWEHFYLSAESTTTRQTKLSRLQSTFHGSHSPLECRQWTNRQHSYKYIYNSINSKSSHCTPKQHNTGYICPPTFFYMLISYKCEEYTL